MSGAQSHNLLTGNDLFISDIHLDGVNRERQELLERFLSVHARQAARLFILGDLFNAWFGRKQLGDEYVRRLTAALSGVAAAGVEVHFIAGNRDFYGLRELGQAASMATYSSGITVESFGCRVYLCHGHRLFSADHRTRSAQKITHSRLVETIFQSLPKELARFLALGYQNHSRRVVRHKSRRMLSFSDSMVMRLFSGGHQAIVCGHAHRLNHTVYRRIDEQWDFISLGCWDRHPHFLRRGPDGWHVHTLEQSAAAVGFDFAPPEDVAGAER